jgi:hypothetical protein
MVKSNLAGVTLKALAKFAKSKKKSTKMIFFFISFSFTSL